MASYSDLMQMCRLCLVKDQVNLPIFGGQGDIQQIFLKITACLPVKVSREDNLPKSICDGCSYKLDLLYQFWNTSSNSEKQLIDWLTAAGVDPKHKSLEPIGLASQPNVILKQEPVTELDAISSDTQNYLMQQQQLAYKPEEYEEPQQDPIQSTKKKATSESADETPSKRPRRATRNTKSVQEVDDSEEDYVDNSETGIAKTEDESEEEEEDEEDDEDGEDVDDGDDMADPDFVAEEDADADADQPGPSGVSGSKSSSATYGEEEVYNTDDGETEEILIQTVADHNYQCEVCALVFSNRESYLEHHMSQFGSRFSCCRCGNSFKNTTELYQHYETHKAEAENQYYVEEEDESETDKYETEYIVTEEVDENSELYDHLSEDQSNEIIYQDEQVEAVINIPGDTAINTTQELLYILDDDNQCVNEVVIETADHSLARKTQQTVTSSNKADYSVVQVDHGYIIPACFRGQLEAKKRIKKEQQSVTTYVRISDTESQLEPTTSSVSFTTRTVQSETKSKLSTMPRRRHTFSSAVPDFSATSYEVIDPNNEVDIVHYKCLRCEQLFINKYVFFRHIEKGKCYINSCDVCPMTFAKNTEFYNHYLEAHTDRAICNFCFRTFMYEKNVKEHMLRHLDQFRHRCEECNKGFYTVREYRNHYKNRHMGIRHKCSVCGRSFADDYYFKKHIATHGLQIATDLIQI